MTLSKFTLKNIQGSKVQNVPDGIFELPEKVLQFGTGVLLRGLPDYFIDKANRQGIFNGRIVVVKSTSGGDSAAFEKQDGLYTLCIRGVENGKAVSENIVGYFKDNSIDMGTGFDCLSPWANTQSDKITAEQMANRTVLVNLMAEHNFTNYDGEWWHYTLQGEPFPDTYFDFPIQKDCCQ